MELCHRLYNYNHNLIPNSGYKAEVIRRNSGTLLEEGERTYTYTFQLRNVRSNAKKGEKGCFWLKADNFNQGKAKKFEFTYQ